MPTSEMNFNDSPERSLALYAARASQGQEGPPVQQPLALVQGTPALIAGRPADEIQEVAAITNESTLQMPGRHADVSGPYGPMTRRQSTVIRRTTSFIERPDGALLGAVQQYAEASAAREREAVNLRQELQDVLRAVQELSLIHI